MLKNITLIFAVFFVIGCENKEENQYQLLDAIGENLNKEILFVWNDLRSQIPNIKRFPNSLVREPQLKKIAILDSSMRIAIDEVKTVTSVGYEIKNEKLQELSNNLSLSSDLIVELLDEFKESSTIEYGRVKLDLRLKNHIDFTAPELNTEEQKVALLNEMLRLTKLTHEFIDLVLNAITGDGMVVSNVQPLVVFLPQDLSNDEALTASVILTGVNKSMLCQFYTGEFDKDKIDDSKPFTWSLPGEFKSPPLNKGYVKLKSIEGIGKISLGENKNISGVVEILSSKGELLYLPFKTKGTTN